MRERERKKKRESVREKTALYRSDMPLLLLGHKLSDALLQAGGL